MSPNWHLGRSRHLEKATRCCQAKRLISLVRSAWFRPILDWLWRKSKSVLFQKVTCYLWQGQCRSGHRWRSVLRITADKQNGDLCDGQGWTLEKATRMLSNWTSGRPPDSVMDFQLTFEEGQARPFVKVTSYTWQSQCRSRHQRRSRHLEKSRTVLSCLTSAGSFITSDFVGTIPAAISRLTLKKVKSDCFRRSLPIRTSENINAKDNIRSILSSENVRAEPRKVHGAFKLNFWKASRFPPWTSDGLWRRVKRDCLRRFTSHFRQGQCRSGTSEKVSVEGNSWQVEYSPLWRSRVNLEKSHTVLSCWTSGRPPDSRHGFPTDFWRRSSVTVCEAYILHLTKSMPDQDIREGQNISKKVTRCFHAWLLQILSLRLISLARIPLDSVRFRRLHPTDSTTIFDQADDYQEKASLSVSEAGPAWKIQKAAAASQQLARYRRCLVPSAGHSFGKPQRDCVSETCLLSQLAGAGVGICVHNRWTADDTQKRPRLKVSVNPWEIVKIFIKFWRERLSHQFKGGNEAQKKLS